MRLHQSFVNEPDDRFAYSHGSMIARTGDGGLACVWFSGTLEGHGDVVGRLSRLHPGGPALLGPAWSPPQTVADGAGAAVGNPVLHIDDGAWTLFYVAFPPRTARLTRVMMRRSDDAGETWTPARELSDRPGYWPRHPPITIDGAWLLPMCEIHRRPPRSMIWRSADRGESWEEIALPGTESLIQPALVRDRAGDLQVYLRDMRCRHIFRMASGDGGASWSAPEPLALPNNNAGIGVLALSSGRLLLAYTDQQRRDRRSPIMLALSDDGGVSWPVRRTLVPFVDVEAARLQYSYPSMVQMPDGIIHLSLTHRTERIAHYGFGEDWVAAGDPLLVGVAAAGEEAPRCAVRRLHIGETVYLADKATRLVSAPPALLGAPALCPLNDASVREARDARGELTLTLGRPADLIIAFDAACARLPRWLDAFQPYSGLVETTGATHRLLALRLPAGRHRLGANSAEPARPGHAMYVAFLLDPGA